MKVLVRAVIAVVAMFMAAALGLVAIVLIDVDDAGATQISNSGGGLHGVPAQFQPWILKATAACRAQGNRELTPALLAAQLYQESKFKTSPDEATSDKGAQGPAQFMPGTWATYGYDADNNGSASPWDIGDAVMSQGRYMCSLLTSAKKSGFGGDARALALAGYNAGWDAVERYQGIPPYKETENYVKNILSTMPRFQGPSLLQVEGSGYGADALRKAAARMGTPYAWGGGGPNGPSTGFCDGTDGYLNGKCSASSTVGFDCSSLVQYAYWPNIQLPRTAAAQYGATSNRPVSRSDLQPGDLLFWSHGNSVGSIYHVAMYAGDANALQAPRTGRSVELDPLTSAMPESDYYGATRP